MNESHAYSLSISNIFSRHFFFTFFPVLDNSFFPSPYPSIYRSVLFRPLSLHIPPPLSLYLEVCCFGLSLSPTIPLSRYLSDLFPVDGLMRLLHVLHGVTISVEASISIHSTQKTHGQNWNTLTEKLACNGKGSGGYKSWFKLKIPSRLCNYYPADHWKSPHSY